VAVSADVSASNTVETITGRIPVRTGTNFIGPIDNCTSAVGACPPAGEASSALQTLKHYHGSPSAPACSVARQVVVLFLRACYLSDGSLGVTDLPSLAMISPRLHYYSLSVAVALSCRQIATSLPLNRTGWFGRDIKNDAVNALDLVNDAIGDAG